MQQKEVQYIQDPTPITVVPGRMHNYYIDDLPWIRLTMLVFFPDVAVLRRVRDRACASGVVANSQENTNFIFAIRTVGCKVTHDQNENMSSFLLLFKVTCTKTKLIIPCHALENF